MCLQIYILLSVPFENSGTLPLCPLVSPLVSKFSLRHPNPFIYKQYGRPTQRHGHRHNPHMHSQMHKHRILMSTSPEDSLYLLSAGLGSLAFSPDVSVRENGAGSSQMSPLPILHDPCRTVEA